MLWVKQVAHQNIVQSAQERAMPGKIRIALGQREPTRAGDEAIQSDRHVPLSQQSVL